MYLNFKTMISKKVIYLIAILSFQLLATNFLSAQITEQEEIFKVVEDMPRFPGCENQGLTKNELKNCSEKALLKYINSNLIYPKVAIQNEIIGKVFLQFVIEKDGSINNPKVVHDIGGGCGEEATRLVNAMPKWIPGKQKGIPVRVQYTLDVIFLLDDIEEVALTFVDQDIEEEEEEEEIVEEPVEEEIFKVVEDMPRFPGCENQGLGKNELKSCSQRKMLEYLYSNIKYPNEAKDSGIEGKVVLQFIIEKDGSISNIKILRDIGSGCGNEAVRVVKSMPKFVTGKSRGKPIRIQYTLPVTFQL